MSNPFEYKTISKPVINALLKIKGSKFYGLLFNVTNESEIKKRLEETKELYPQATHYCYAFRLGVNGETYRANDDGEPSGTAGLPIYNQLLSSEITNVLLIVVRYFGGTKLGVGGLIKAYKESAQYTIENVEIITRELSESYQLQFDYSHQSSVMILLKKLNIEIYSSEFASKCSLVINVPLKKKNDFLDKFNSLFSQKFVIQNKVS